MKKILRFSLFFCLLLILGVCTVLGVLHIKEHSKNEVDILILYENDVHCNIDGYSKIAAMKDEYSSIMDYVGVVSVGDFIQGGSLGVVSQGEYIVDLMNMVGYDAITLGNHEFDYKLPRLSELSCMMDTKPVCCNFEKIGKGRSFFEPYNIVSYGDVDIAYIGVTTPSTISSSVPYQFKDEQGNYLYTFNAENLYDVVQKNIDEAKSKGADYIICLSHMGYYENSPQQDVTDLIENTSGFDVVLDGHSHTIIEKMIIDDKKGDDVILSSTGSNFQNIGQLRIKDGNISTSLVKTEIYEKTSSEIDGRIQTIEEEYGILGNRVIATSDINLITHDKDGNRIIRTTETNLGNLCADAYRYVSGANISYINGGGIRKDIKAGDVTFNDILNVFPFNDQLVVCEITGAKLLDMLEFTMSSYPNENGAFPHVSGIIFSFNTSISSSVVKDANGVFAGVDGEYRVYDVKVWNDATLRYEDLDLAGTYTFASHDYLIIEQGSGMSMFEDVKIIQQNGFLDVEILEKYIVENLNRHIGEDYSILKKHINFTDGKN